MQWIKVLYNVCKSLKIPIFQKNMKIELYTSMMKFQGQVHETDNSRELIHPLFEVEFFHGIPILQ